MTNKLITKFTNLSARTTALIAGFGLLAMTIAAIFANFSVFESLVVHGDAITTTAPVIRPYNIQNRTWDFSRSYINLSFALRFKSYSLREQHSWSESFGSANTKGGNL